MMGDATMLPGGSHQILEASKYKRLSDGCVYQETKVRSLHDDGSDIDDDRSDVAERREGGDHTDPRSPSVSTSTQLKRSGHGTLRCLVAGSLYLIWSALGPSTFRDDTASSITKTMPLSQRSKHWMDTKAKICPQMSPNHRVWSKVIELAKLELGIADEDIPAREEDKEAISLFFRFNAGGLGYRNNSLADGHRHMVYLRVFKCGNSQIYNNLYPHGERHLIKDPYWWASNPISGVFEDTTKSNSISANNTCLLTALRDPVDHFLSGYNELMHRRHSRLPHGHGNGTANGFMKFVRDFVTGPVSTRVYSGRMEALELTHVYSLSGLLWGLKRLQDCHGKEKAPRLTAYLPSLHNLNTNFPAMAKEHCPGIVPQLDSFGHQHVHQSQSDQYNYYSSAKEVWREGVNTSRALCIMHILDYACFSDLPIPDICMTVYADQVFREALLQAAEGENRDFVDEDSCARDFPVI